MPLRRLLLPCLAAATLLVTGSFASDEALVYQSHFEDNLHQLTDWRAGDSSESFELTVRKLAPDERSDENQNEAPAALVLRCHEAQTPLRIAQVAGLFRLLPEQSYTLRVTLRTPELEVNKGGRVCLLVTDARWKWSSPPLLIDERNPEWHTLSLPFTAPAAADGHFRVRIEALPAALHLEVAEISVIHNLTQ